MGSECRENISCTSALAVLLDLRPLSFAENRPGMAAYARAVFEAGQYVPYGVAINPESYLLTNFSIMSYFFKLIEEQKKGFSEFCREHLATMGGAVTVDDVLLKS